jgi:hypothetical protein
MHLNDKAVLNLCKELCEPSVSWFEVRSIKVGIATVLGAAVLLIVILSPPKSPE